MTYYINMQDHADDLLLDTLMEVLAAQAETNPDWTMQGLLALCRKTSCLEDEPQNADYFDGVYLVLAELFEQFQQTGGLSGPPEALRRVRSFTLDAASQQEVAAALAALRQGVIQGRPRMLVRQWQQEGSWADWQQRLSVLEDAVRGARPQSTAAAASADAGEEEQAEDRPKGSKLMTILLFWFALQFTGLALWLTLQGAFALWGSVRLRVQGQQASGQVVRIVSQLHQANPHRVQPRAGYTSFAVAAFRTESGQYIEARLPEPWPGPRAWEPDLYQEGDAVQVRYLPDAPACIEDANSASQLLRGAVLLGIGLGLFLVTCWLSRGLFAGLGTAGRVLSAASKVLLLALAAGLFYWQNLPVLYRYLPAAEEDSCYTQDGLLLRQRDDKPFTGRMRTRTENSLYIYTYRDGVLDGPDVVYTNGAVKETGRWKDGQQNGLFTLYTEAGVLVDHAWFENGLRHGLTRQFDPETGRMVMEGLCQNGLQEGEWLHYYPETGQVMAEQTFREGLLNGPARQYYPVGVRQLQIEMNYVDGVPEGPYKLYYPNGQLQLEAELKNGSYNGEVKTYAEDGTPVEPAWEMAADPAQEEEEITITEVE